MLILCFVLIILDDSDSLAYQLLLLYFLPVRVNSLVEYTEMKVWISVFMYFIHVVLDILKFYLLAVDGREWTIS